MAHTVTIYYESTSLLSLTLVDYTPASAPASQPTVTETWEVHVSDSTKSGLQTKLAAINRVFEQARHQARNDQLGRVYLYFQPSGYTAPYRSQVVDGKLEYYNETLKWAWANTAFDVRLIITRLNYWEGAETAIPLSNSNGADVTAGLNVYNVADGAGSTPNVRENWADIDADDLKGDLPAPLKLSLARGGGGDIFDVILALCNNGDPSLLQHMAECEDASFITGTGANANCSGGEYGYTTFGSVDTAEQIFTFPSQDGWPTGFMVGRWYLPLLRLYIVPTIADLWTRVRSVCGVENVTEWVNYPASGGAKMIQYPPVRFGLPRMGSPFGYFQWQFKTSTSGSKTINGDCVYMLPLDGVRFYDVTLSGASGDDTLFDDPYDGLVYFENVASGGGDYELILARGKPLFIDPQHDARLYFISPGDTALNDKYTIMQAWYRPRRLAL